MFKTFKPLPEHYQPLYEINLKENKREFLFLNILSLVLFFLCMFVFVLIKPSGTFDFVQLFIVLIGSIIYILLHEIIHALFFRIKNKVKVQFKFHGFAASASVPGVYYQKKHFLLIALAPFVVFTLLLIPILFFLNAYWFTIIYLIFAFHVSGCAGDFYVFFKVALTPKDLLIEDYGIGMRIFHKVDDDHENVSIIE